MIIWFLNTLFFWNASSQCFWVNFFFFLQIFWGLLVIDKGIVVQSACAATSLLFLHFFCICLPCCYFACTHTIKCVSEGVEQRVLSNGVCQCDAFFSTILRQGAADLGHSTLSPSLSLALAQFVSFLFLLLLTLFIHPFIKCTPRFSFSNYSYVIYPRGDLIALKEYICDTELSWQLLGKFVGPEKAKLWWKLLQISAACCTYFMHQSFVCVWMCMPHCCMRINDCSVHFILLFCGGFVLWVLNWKGRNQQSCVVWAAGAACTFMFLYKSFWIQLKYWASSQSCDQIGIQPLFLSSRGLSTLLDMTC